MKYKFRKTHSTRDYKKQIVSKLEEELKAAKSVLLFESSFVTHKQFEELRKKLKTASAKLRFVKNTLFRVTGKKLNLPEKIYQDEVLKGPTALVSVLSEDFISPIKVLKEELGKNENVKIKIGLLDNELYQSQQVWEFASIPGKTELYTKLVGSLQSPLYRLRYALNYNVGKLVRGIKEVSRVKRD